MSRSLEAVTVTGTEVLRERAQAALNACGARLSSTSGASIRSRTPITGETLFDVPAADASATEGAIARARAAAEIWRDVPAPQRGALIKRLAELIGLHREALADLVMIEAGKIRSEALGEVQEMIDVCDLAVGLSRQIGGVTLPSERPGHRLMETWHPLGVIAVITAFNFPVAVWSWNVALALVCGDTVIWKPSPTTSLCALACSALLDRAAADCGAPADLGVLVIGEAEAAAPLLDSADVALVSATGSERMGAAIAPRVAARFGRLLLELGGNNAAVVAPSADLELCVRGISFAAAGTAGQRCTTLRRLIVHRSVADELLPRLCATFAQLAIGDPFDDVTLVGPLIEPEALTAMSRAIDQARADGGELLVGGERLEAAGHPEAAYVQPAIVRMPAQTPVVRQETFAPLLHVLTYDDLEEAVALNNGVPQGLSSSIFTRDAREAERFMAAGGSDCGIVNVNIGTSGAEVGGAFGGEKTTGGGRESGSDAWRAYMRRATNTINYSDALPLAQGVRFG